MNALLWILQIVLALLMMIPAGVRRAPRLTPIAATLLAVEALGLAAFYAKTSLAIAATNPLVWSLAIGLLAAFLAYGRFNLEPLTPAGRRTR